MAFKPYLLIDVGKTVESAGFPLFLHVVDIVEFGLLLRLLRDYLHQPLLWYFPYGFDLLRHLLSLQNVDDALFKWVSLQSGSRIGPGFDGSSILTGDRCVIIDLKSMESNTLRPGNHSSVLSIR